MDNKPKSEEEKLKALQALGRVIQEGYAGIKRDGGIVDRRLHPDALPIPGNSLLGAPEPKKIGVDQADGLIDRLNVFNTPANQETRPLDEEDEDTHYIGALDRYYPLSAWLGGIVAHIMETLRIWRHFFTFGRTMGVSLATRLNYPWIYFRWYVMKRLVIQFSLNDPDKEAENAIRLFGGPKAGPVDYYASWLGEEAEAFIARRRPYEPGYYVNWIHWIKNYRVFPMPENQVRAIASEIVASGMADDPQNNKPAEWFYSTRRSEEYRQAMAIPSFELLTELLAPYK